MGITRAYRLTALALASGMFAGCWGDCWCTGGSCKGTQPKTSQNATAVNSTGQQSDGWNTRQRTQETNVSSAASQQSSIAGPSDLGQTRQMQPLGASNLSAATGGSLDSTPAAANPVRTVSATGTPPAPTNVVTPPPPAATSNSNPPPGTTPPITQRDSWQSPQITAPQAPFPPPPPPSLTPSGSSSSTSKYSPATPLPNQPPPDTIPNQSKIPTLPPGPMPLE